MGKIDCTRYSLLFVIENIKDFTFLGGNRIYVLFFIFLVRNRFSLLFIVQYKQICDFDSFMQRLHMQV